MKKLLAIILTVIMTLALFAFVGSGTSLAGNYSTGGAPLSDAELWYENRTYTIKEYLDLEPRIMIMDKPKFMGKNNGVESIYVIKNDLVIEKTTVPSSSYKSLEEMGKFSDKDWTDYLLGLKKITLGELAQMNEDDLWEYIDMLETVSETPLDLHVFTDRSGNWVIGEDISDLLNFDNYMDHPEMGYMNFPVYNKYYIGYAIITPRERTGYYFLSDEDIMLVMDDWSTPGVAVD